MKKFVSISQYPGTTGSYFYNSFFREYDVAANYSALSADITTFEKVFKNALELGVAGISISMPFKKTVLDFLDNVDTAVEEYQLCNTVIIDNGESKGYNCDFYALDHVSSDIPKDYSIKVLGIGSIGSMVKKFLEKTHRVKVYSRSLGNWDSRHNTADVVFNCSSLGTIPGCPLDHLEGIKLVYDYSIGSTLLPALCSLSKVKYIGGLEFYKYQFSKQFELYTKLKFDSDLFDKLKQAKYD